jgi:hypothetical protein
MILGNGFAVAFLAVVVWMNELSQTIASELSPVYGSSNDFTFVSIPTKMASQIGVEYQVCNRSNSSNGFFWVEAGFGVGAGDELTAMHCARMESYSGDYLTTVPSEVQFQDGNVGHTETLKHCKQLLGRVDSCGDSAIEGVYNFISTLKFFGRSPDQNNIEMKSVQLGIQQIRSDLSASISVASSDHIEAVLLTFPMGKVDSQQETNIFLNKGMGDFSLTSLANAREELGIKVSFLDADIPANSLTVRLPASVTSSGAGAYSVTERTSQLGPIIELLVVDSGQVVARGRSMLQLQDSK